MIKQKDKKVIFGLSKHLFHVNHLGVYYTYLAQQAEDMGMLKFAQYLKHLADDKKTVHMDLIYNYLIKIDTILDPKADSKDIEMKKFKTPREIAEELLRTEENDRERVDKFATELWDMKDHETYSFWRWFIDDALKDLNEIKDINDAFNTSDDLLTIDNRIGKISEIEAEGSVNC